MPRFPTILLAAPALVLAGCTAFNVGSPSVESHERTVYETADAPRIQVTDVRMVHHAASGDSISVGLVADVRDEYARTSHVETDKTSRQRRLAFGFFPAAAELYCVPDKAERSACFKYGYPATFALGLPFTPLGTVRSLFLELPFGSYDCSKGKARDAFSHVGILGFHKYTTTTKWVEAGPKRREAPQVTVRNAIPVPGPFEVEMDIPDLGGRPQTGVAGGDGRTAFQLPAVSRDQTVRVRVVFRTSLDVYGSGMGELTSRVLNHVAGRRYAFDLTLRGDGSLPPDGGRGERPPPIYRIREIRPEANGRYVVRAEILDESRTLAIALRIVQPEVRQLVRENYQSNHPGEPIPYIREFLQYETEEDGRVLVFTGWAFSVRPAEDGWRYDSRTRRGWVRMRIAGGIPAADAKRWARENIEAIVSDKNVVVAAGEAPPLGAKYRSLGETYEKGILKIDFEAVE